MEYFQCKKLENDSYTDCWIFIIFIVIGVFYYYKFISSMYPSSKALWLVLQRLSSVFLFFGSLGEFQSREVTVGLEAG